MSSTRKVVRLAVIGLFAAIVASACAANSTATTTPAAERRDQDAYPALNSLAPVTEPVATTEPQPSLDVSASASPIALIDADGQLALVVDGAVDDRWFKWRAFPAPDGNVAVLTLPPEISGIGSERPVTWVSLPDGTALAEQSMKTGDELTATSLDGSFAAFTSRADAIAGDAIAGARSTSTIRILSRDDGQVYERELAGNFAPEAFSRRTLADGTPAQIFLLEYFPAEAPRFYRVRVLSTETGEVSLPLNLRNKSQQVDERMAGFSRSQVVAHEQGLLFTLYRGTIDGTPDGEPYAFVHTLDLADGVWCLDVDPRLELDRLPGSLAVAGDRLYVASANGFVGSFPIPSITDPNLSPAMDWVVAAPASSDGAPVIVADDDGVYVTFGPDHLLPVMRIGPTGEIENPKLPMGAGATALAWHGETLVGIGADWSTFELGPRPEWLGEVTQLFVGG